MIGVDAAQRGMAIGSEEEVFVMIRVGGAVFIAQLSRVGRQNSIIGLPGPVKRFSLIANPCPVEKYYGSSCPTKYPARVMNFDASDQRWPE